MLQYSEALEVFLHAKPVALGLLVTHWLSHCIQRDNNYKDNNITEQKLHTTFHLMTAIIATLYT